MAQPTDRHTNIDPGTRGGVIRVVIADDHAIVREGLRALVDAQPGLTVIGEAASGAEAVERVCELRPDVAVLDLSMPGGGGADAAERIAADCPGVRVVALTMHEERGYVARMLRAGAVGYVLKRTASSELVRAIRAVAAGERYIDSSLAGTLLSAQARSHTRRSASDLSEGLATLTARENELLRLVAQGHSNKEIAGTMSISVKTVETHKANAMATLGLQSRAALVRFALDAGWLEDR